MLKFLTLSKESIRINFLIRLSVLLNKSIHYSYLYGLINIFLNAINYFNITPIIITKWSIVKLCETSVLHEN